MSEMRMLLAGRGLVESPRWHGDRLYFSDWSAGEVIAVDLAGRSEVIARVKSLPLCTAWLPDGRLLIVSSQAGLLLRREPDGSAGHPRGPRPARLERHRGGRPRQCLRQPRRLRPDGRGGVQARLRRPGHAGRLGARGGRRHRLPQRDGGDRRQLHADRRGLATVTSWWPSTSARTAACPAGGSGPTSATAPRTASASTPRAPSGTPTCPTSAASASPRAARCCRPSTLDRGGFACALGGPRRHDAVHRGRRVAGHDRADGGARQRPGPRHRGRGARRGLAVAPAPGTGP